jgi:hypothetical protein
MSQDSILLILAPSMLTFGTGKNPCFRLITRPRLSKDPKRLIIPTFWALNPCFRKNINLLFQDNRFFPFLFLNNNRTPAFLLFCSTGITDKNISFRKHQHFTFWTKLHVYPSGLHPLRSLHDQTLIPVTHSP